MLQKQMNHFLVFKFSFIFSAIIGHTFLPLRAPLYESLETNDSGGSSVPYCHSSIVSKDGVVIGRAIVKYSVYINGSLHPNLLQNLLERRRVATATVTATQEALTKKIAMSRRRSTVDLSLEEIRSVIELDRANSKRVDLDQLGNNSESDDEREDIVKNTLTVPIIAHKAHLSVPTNLCLPDSPHAQVSSIHVFVEDGSEDNANTLRFKI